MTTTTSQAVEDIDEESPSSIKQGTQRYFILAGVLITLLFVYLFITMSMGSDSDSEGADAKPVVPEQLQEGEISSPTSAVAEFNRSLQRKEQTSKPATAKVEDAGIPQSLAPRKTVSNTEVTAKQDRRRSASKKPTSAIVEPPTALAKFQEQEQLRAMRSLSSRATLGDDSVFYGDQSSQGAKSRVKKSRRPLTIDEKQKAVQKQIAEITAYREAIERGDIDASKPPSAIMNLLGGTQ